jgi:N-acetyl sugar amidotransferase
MSLKICSRCIYDENTPGIKFNERGVCNYCEITDQLLEEYKTGTPEGEQKLLDIVEVIKQEGKGKKYDCVVGVSGGTDSSYMLVLAKELGLRPLAVHYDNTWNTAIATENIRKMLTKLNIDLYTYVIDNKESDDIFRSFFRANVPDLDIATDLALAEVLYRAASKFGIKYILEGHSFLTEGIAPLGSGVYMDGAYIKNVHRQFGMIKMQTYPLMDFKSFMKWSLVKRIKKIRPFWYVKYTKKDARSFLESNYGWQYYGGHHLENRITSFTHSVYFPQKFGIDLRNLSLAADVRAGLMTREEALAEFAKPPHIESELIQYFKKRLELSDQEYENVMKGPKKSYRDFKTYKKRFERLRPLFYMLAKANLVPMSFYIKYTSKNEI